MDVLEAAGSEIASEQFAELASLGVTVRDREEFEDGVMRQLDREAAKRSIEQQKKFTEKELVDVRKEINMVGVELGNLDKTISALIKLPIASIASKLRSTKSQKELKEKQLLKLRARELALSTKIQTGKFENDFNQGDNEGSDDIAFGISVAPGNKKMADLIQHGHMTPFGGQIIDGVYHGGNMTAVTRDLPSISNTDLSSNSANIDNSSHMDLTSNSTNSDLPCNLDSTITSANSDLVNYSKNIDVTNSSQSTDLTTYSKNLSDFPEITNDSAERSCAVENSDSEHSLGDETHKDKGKGKAPIPYDEFSDSDENEDDTFIPYLNEDEDSFLSSEDSSCDTVARGGSSSKVKHYRDIDTSESDDDMIHTNKVKRPLKKTLSSRQRSQRCLPDDGDDQLYKLRMRELGRAGGSEDDENYEDMKFSGGLRIPGRIWHRLYKYQRTGVQWLWELHSQQAGGIVGDEMGLGKTIQMIAFLAGLNVSKLYSNVTRCRGLGPVLIVCPATVLQQWVREFFTWWPYLRVVILHSTGSFQGNKMAMINRMVKCNAVVITSYQGVWLHRDSLLRYKWDYIILDEGHKIRNPDANITLTCKQFMTPHKIILSGSPMQNNLKELWSLFDFVFPGKLGTLPVFMEQFSVPITIGGYSTATKIQVQTAYRCACVLRDTISPYLLRRHKADVKIQLPPKYEQVLFCRLTDIQREMYEDYLKSPEVSDMLVGRTKVFAGISRLRKICNHPDLLGGGKTSHQSGSDEEGSCDAVMEYGHYNHSGKMVVVNSLLKVWHSLGHRVLLFSQTRKMLDVLERLVKSCGYTFRRMDGSTPVGSRQYLINCFNEDTSIFVFLLTTRVGGLGVNLTGADRVVIYDPDWNPSTDTQARERAWRIGQDKQVTIYRLLTTGTIEEKIYHRQIFKQFLTNRILRDPRQRRLFKTNDLYDLFTLGSSDTPSSETGALFAGTESEVSVDRKKTRSQKERPKKQPTSSLSTTHSPPLHTSTTSSTHNDTSSSKSSSNISGSKTKLKSIDEIRKAWQVQLFGNKETDTDETSSSTIPSSSSSGTCNDSTSGEQPHRKQRKRRHDGTIVDGAAIMGLERTAVYEEQQVEKENKKENDAVLKMLMKKSGLHSAFQHDAMVNGGDPDYVLIESEAEHVAQSAAHALLQSRQQCQNRGWGLLTWTGQNGTTGNPSMSEPRQRFGSAKQLVKATQNETEATLFTGEELQCGIESNTAGSASFSSSLLLNKIQQRNAHKNGTNLPVNSGHVEQLREIRDFIACQCSKDGQATTAELISHFSGSSYADNQSTFRSMLNEICEFYREDGVGTWRLKPEYRY